MGDTTSPDTTRRRELWLAVLPRVIVAGLLLAWLKRLGTGLGYLARYWTAEAVGELLRLGGVASLESHEVLLLENSIAQVDLPCAGLKSLWTAMAFLVVAQLLRRGQLGWLFWTIAAAMELAVLAGNTTRVALLVWLVEVAQRPDWAHACHLPLGLLFFTLACASAYLALQSLDPRPAQSSTSTPPAQRWRSLAFCGVGVVLWLGGASRPPANAAAPPLPHLPALLAPQAHALSPAESRFFAGQAARVGKWQGEIAALGTRVPVELLVVAAATWRAHHAPELCLLAAGYRIDRLETLEPAGLFPMRRLTLDGGRWQAWYFFQSRRGTTPHLTQRLVDGLWASDENWFLVCLILPGDLPPTSPVLRDFLSSTRLALAKTLSPTAPEEARP